MWKGAMLQMLEKNWMVWGNSYKGSSTVAVSSTTEDIVYEKRTEFKFEVDVCHSVKTKAWIASSCTVGGAVSRPVFFFDFQRIFRGIFALSSNFQKDYCRVSQRRQALTFNLTQSIFRRLSWSASRKWLCCGKEETAVWALYAVVTAAYSDEWIVKMDNKLGL